MTIHASPELTIAFVLGVIRASAWLVLVPPFGTRDIPVQVKVGFAVALALPTAQSLAERHPPVETAGLVGAVLLQVAVGLVLGFFTLLLFSAVQAAGELIDVFGGFNAAQLFDPLSQVHASLYGRLYQLVATTILFTSNGHLLLVKGFLRSYDAVSLQAPPLGKLAEATVSATGMFFVAAVELAAPLLGALFLTEVGLGLLSRAAPQMNVLALGFPLKIFLALVLAGVALPLLPSAVHSLLLDSVRFGNGALRLFGGG